MRTFVKLTLAATGLAAAAAIGGCTDSGYGYRASVGYDVAYGDPYWGWYGDYYYPGTGGFVYDHNRHRVPWTTEQQGYWQGRRTNWHGPANSHSNWHDFHRR